MARHVLAVLILGALAGVVFVHADDAPKKKDDKAVRDDVAMQQQRLAAQYRDFEQALLRLAQRLERSSKPEDQARARTLKEAIRKSSDENINTKFDKLISTLRASKELDLQEIKEAMEQSQILAADIRAPDWRTLDAYCDRVASAVGRLSVRVFGMEEKAGIALAHHLGRALQLTNILRDLDEDAAIGRLYLPREALQQANILSPDPKAVLDHPRLGEACEQVVARAREHFAEADRIMKKCRRSTVRAPRIMAEAYKAILRKLVKRGWASPREPVKVSKPLLILTILRYAFI